MTTPKRELAEAEADQKQADDRAQAHKDLVAGLKRAALLVHENPHRVERAADVAAIIDSLREALESGTDLNMAKVRALVEQGLTPTTAAKQLGLGPSEAHRARRWAKRYGWQPLPGAAPCVDVLTRRTLRLPQRSN